MNWVFVCCVLLICVYPCSVRRLWKRKKSQHNKLCFVSLFTHFARGGCHEQMYCTSQILIITVCKYGDCANQTSCTDMLWDDYQPVVFFLTNASTVWSSKVVTLVLTNSFWLPGWKEHMFFRGWAVKLWLERLIWAFDNFLHSLFKLLSCHGFKAVKSESCLYFLTLWLLFRNLD